MIWSPTKQVDRDSEHFNAFKISPQHQHGQFRGREEAVYKLKNRNSALFVFVIEGAFELMGRLIHPRDGLALWDLEEEMVDLEALSNEAVIVLMEVGKR